MPARPRPLPQVLWLSENPCADAPDYRATAVRSLPHLEKLDNRDVTAEERAAALAAAPTLRPAASAELDPAAAADAWAAEAGAADEAWGSGCGAPSGSKGGGAGAAAQLGGAEDAGGAARRLSGRAGVGVGAGGGWAMAGDPAVEGAAVTQPRAGSCQQEAAAAAGGAAGAARGGGTAHRNILYAVMALLPELDARELALVAREAERLSLGAK